MSLTSLLTCYRKEEEHGVTLQLQLFEEHKANDDELHPAAKNVDLSSPMDVFHAIYKQVSRLSLSRTSLYRRNVYVSLSILKTFFSKLLL